MLHKIFPTSYRVFPRNGFSLFVNILMWILMCFGFIAIGELIRFIPIIGVPLCAIVKMAGTFYCLIGIILAILVCLGIIKN